MKEINDITKANFSFGIETNENELILTAHPRKMNPTENPVTVFVKRDKKGKWYDLGNVSWIANGINPNSNGDSIMLGHISGTCLEKNEEGHIFSNVHETPEIENIRKSQLIFIKRIDGKVYAGGTNRYLYEYQGDSWKEISIKKMQGEPMPSCFENITGFNADELYAFGWKGVVWTNKDNKWRQIHTPTDYMLYAGDVLEDKVYIAGQLGVILEGRGDNFKLLNTSHLEDDDIYDVCTFQNTVYLSTISGILCIKNGKVEMFKKRTEDFKTYRIFVGPNGLYSVADGHLAVYDGNDWKMLTQH